VLVSGDYALQCVSGNCFGAWTFIPLAVALEQFNGSSSRHIQGELAS
jgi:hypothetical protein